MPARRSPAHLAQWRTLGPMTDVGLNAGRLGPVLGAWPEGRLSFAAAKPTALFGYSPRAKSLRRARKFGRAGPIFRPGSTARCSLADLRVCPAGPVHR